MNKLSRQGIMQKEKSGELVKVFNNDGKFLGWRKPLYGFPAPPGFTKIGKNDKYDIFMKPSTIEKLK